WDAFLAPAGSPLLDLVTRTGKLSWPKARPILEQLTEELIQAEADGTLPASLAAAQVWIHADGRTQLLDRLLTQDPGARLQAGVKAQISESSLCSPEQPSMDLLRQVAVLSLEG